MEKCKRSYEKMRLRLNPNYLISLAWKDARESNTGHTDIAKIEKVLDDSLEGMHSVRLTEPTGKAKLKTWTQ